MLVDPTLDVAIACDGSHRCDRFLPGRWIDEVRNRGHDALDRRLERDRSGEVVDDFSETAAWGDEGRPACAEPLHHRVRRTSGLGPDGGDHADVAKIQEAGLVLSCDDALEVDVVELARRVPHVLLQPPSAGDPEVAL